MHIGILTPGFCASEDDWCVPALTDLVRVLARDDEVTVVALRYPHRRGVYEVHGATVRATGGAQRRGFGRFPVLRWGLAEVLKANHERSFDVLWGLWAHEPGFLATAAGQILGTPAMVSILGGELADLPAIGYGGERSAVNRWLVRRALAGARRVTVGSEYLARIAASRVAAEKLAVAPLGVDRTRFSPGAPSPGVPRLAGAPKILQVASLVPVKDPATLLQAFAALGGALPDAHLHLVGEGALRPELERRARALGVDARVHFHGAVDHGRLADLYRQADLTVTSSLFESQGMTILEAASCGCPVVGTAVGVLPELGPLAAMPGDSAAGDSARDAAAPVAPGDPEALAGAMRAALLDDALRARLRAAQTRALARFDLATTAGELRRLLQELTEENRVS